MYLTYHNLWPGQKWAYGNANRLGHLSVRDVRTWCELEVCSSIGAGFPPSPAWRWLCMGWAELLPAAWALLGFSSQWMPEPATREILDTDAFIVASSCHPQLKLWIWETWCGVPDCYQLWMLRHTAGNGASIRVHHTLWLITAAHVSALEGVQTWDLVSWNVFCMFSKTGFWVSPTLSASEIHQNTYWELLLFNVFRAYKCLVVAGWFLDWREIWSLRSASPVRM